MAGTPRSVSPSTLSELRNDARYERERLALYRAKMLGSRPTSPARLRELEASCERAEARLAHALSPAPNTGEPCPDA